MGTAGWTWGGEKQEALRAGDDGGRHRALEQRSVVRVCVSERVRGDGGGSASHPVGYTTSARALAVPSSNV